ncbi:glycoside hydrolase family 5 protein [Halobacteria archaeon AArc-m2/3/4]|uniref:Glycoside hydrolase family 5 protein n=1 Tax=Natronoglomus mannanivorans TaxID=2979990 RepID=A0ABT2QCS5_9EURY|nr:glycoside hydrolase family 5 protein [Halobacteria archaeon AArc-m2/3/4]
MSDNTTPREMDEQVQNGQNSTTGRARHDNIGKPRGHDTGAWTRRNFVKAAGVGAATAGLSTAFSGSAAAGENMPTPWLHVDGNLVKDPEGNEVVLRGVNVVDPWRANRDAPYYKMHIDDYVELATNEDEGWYSRVVRLPMQPQDIGKHGSGAVDPVAFTEDELLTYLEEHVDSVVEKARERGAYIILDYHRHYPDGPDWTEPALDEEIRLFWNVVAPRYNDQSHVLFEVYNEPTTPYAGHDLGPENDIDIRDPEGEETWLHWRETAQPWVDLIREHAADNLILIGSPSWSQWTYWADEHEFEGENLAYTGHVYTQESLRPLGEYFGKPSENVPVFMTEFGFGGPEPYLQGTREVHGQQFSDLYTEYDSMHWTAWCFDFDWEPSMLDRDYEIKNEWGEWTQEHLEQWADDDLPQVESESPPVGGDNGDDDDDNDDEEPESPTPPADQWVDEATETSIEVGWEAVDGADAYRVFLESDLEEETTATTATITGLEADTAYELGLSTIVGDEESDVVTTTVSTRSEGEPEGPPEIDGIQPADTTGDGLYNDFTGSGSTTTTDVNVFFEHVDDPAVADYPQYYDFDGNGQVSVTDVVDLFESI